MIKKEKWNEIIEVIGEGFTDKDACLYVGISRDSFYRKINEDSDFSDMVKRAQVKFKKIHQDIILESGKRTFQ